MKKVVAILAVAVLVVSLASLAFAGGHGKKGVVKSMDANAGTIVLTIDGKDETLKADKSVDLGKVKAGDKVEVTVEKDTIMTLKASKPKAAVGC